MLIIKNSLQMLVCFSLVTLLAYVFGFQALFIHTAFEVVYYAGLFFFTYVFGSMFFKMLSSMGKRTLN